MTNGFTFITGGAASGKSAHAEHLVRATGRPRVYIATAQAFDDEMRDKIAQHRAARGAGWRTIEAPLAMPDAVLEVAAEEAVLVDCVTLWLSNLMLAEADLEAAGSALLRALAACPAQAFVVSNEVGGGVVPDNALARRFRAAQGRLNQQLAAAAGRVETVISGLPLVLKGAP